MKVQRHLAPTAAPLSWLDLCNGILGSLRPDVTREKRVSEFRRYFGVKHVFLLNSGKAALSIILSALKTGSSRRQVVIPAYTCFSVPSAVLKAGLDVVLCDVDPHTLDFEPDGLRQAVSRDTLAMVAPHLLGQPADLRTIRLLAESVGAFVIEDAAQAMGCRHEGRWLGTQGDVGFFSLGRGKNLSAGSGGVIITNSGHLAQAITQECEKLPVESASGSLANFAAVLAATLLIRPNLYWLPAGLPFLGLGDTKFYRDFPLRRMDGIRAGLLSSWKDRLEESNRRRVEWRRRILVRLPEIGRGLRLIQQDAACHLRVPLLMPAAQGKEALCSQSKSQGLGVSALYPSTISGIPELESQVQPKRFPGAEALIGRLVTLPVHRYVTEKDLDRIVNAVCHSMSITERMSHETDSVAGEGHSLRSPYRVMRGRGDGGN